MVKCIVPECSSQNSRKKLEQNIKISLHRLPKDINKRILWLKNIGLHKDQNLPKSASVCSLHFKEEDVNRTLDIITLRENAIPYNNTCIDATCKKENEIENNQNCLNSSFSSVEDAHTNQLSCLETSFSSSDTYCAKKINTRNHKYNHQEEISIHTDKQMFLNECSRELDVEKNYLLLGEIQEHYTHATTVFVEKSDKCTSTNLDANLNLKVSRSTSVSPQHFQEDRDTIEYLTKSFEKYKRKSKQTITNLKRKLKQKKCKADFDNVMDSLKSKLNKSYLDVLEQMGRFNQDLLKRMISK